MELTPRLSAWLDSSRYASEFSGMSEQELSTMGLDEYARLTGRPTLGEVAAATVANPPAPADPPRSPQVQQGAPAAEQPSHSAEDPGIDFQGMTMAQYEQIRSRYIRPSSGFGRGILGQ